MRGSDSAEEIARLTERVRVSHKLLRELASVTSPEEFPELCERASLELVECVDETWCLPQNEG